MPFRVKNTGTTYERLVSNIFKSLIGNIIKMYVHDMITKSRNLVKHVLYLEETFNLLKKYQMKLYLEKCMFRVRSSKFLEYMVSHKGLDKYPEKIQPILKMMKPPHFLKEIQTLMGKLIALNMFIFKINVISPSKS